MSQFRKKPVVIDAVRWDGTERCLNEIVLPFLADGHKDFEHLPRAPDDPHVQNGIGVSNGEVYIPTLEGTMTARPGDWIIRGVKGEFYPCKPDIFAATYEPVGSAPPGDAGLREKVRQALSGEALRGIVLESPQRHIKLTGVPGIATLEGGDWVAVPKSSYDATERALSQLRALAQGEGTE